MSDITADEYQKLCLRTAGRGNRDDRIIYSAMGLAGESGEYCDHIKKIYFQGHETVLNKIVEELGDVAWYLAMAAHSHGLELGFIMEHNIDKLRKRYPDGFSEERSINRIEPGH